MKAAVSIKNVTLLMTFLTAALAVALLAADSFGQGGTKAEKAAEAASPAVVKSDGWEIRIEMEESSLQALETAALSVAVRGPDGLPVSGATLTMTADMPAMHHPLPESVLTEKTPGVYAGQFVPVMPGKWKAELTAEAEGKTVTFSYGFTVKR